jgi:hypothetical protein
MNIPAPQAGGDPPKVEAGLYVARFDDITTRVVEQFKTESDKFGKPDDGTRFDFEATLLDEQRQPVLLMDVKDGVEDPTLELVLRQAKSVKVFSSDDRSNSYMYLKGILTPAEFVLWQNSTESNPADLSSAQGREVNVQVGHNTKGWPQIEAFLGPAKPLKK